MYLGVLWTAFEILNENKWISQMKTNPQKVTQMLATLNSPALNSIRRLGLGLLALTFVTAMSGGMVAGLDAGLIYPTFPHMAMTGFLLDLSSCRQSFHVRKITLIFGGEIS